MILAELRPPAYFRDASIFSNIRHGDKMPPGHYPAGPRIETAHREFSIQTPNLKECRCDA